MFIVFSGTDPNSKMIFKCYYCKFETGELLQIIQHCNTEHANEALKYREEVLDDKSGKLRLQRKHRQGIIHSVLCKEGKEIVVSNWPADSKESRTLGKRYDRSSTADEILFSAVTFKSIPLLSIVISLSVLRSSIWSSGLRKFWTDITR
jgi:hypothetical protein